MSFRQSPWGSAEGVRSMVQGLSRRAEAPPPLALTVAPSEFLDNLVEEYDKLASENRNLREKLGRERIEKDDLLQAIEEQSKQHATVVSDLRKEVARLTSENESLQSELETVKSIAFRAEHSSKKAAEDAKKASDDVKKLRKELGNLTTQNSEMREGYEKIWLGQLAYTACVEISRHAGLEEEAWDAASLFDAVRAEEAEKTVTSLLQTYFKSAKKPIAVLSSRLGKLTALRETYAHSVTNPASKEPVTRHDLEKAITATFDEEQRGYIIEVLNLVEALHGDKELLINYSSSS